MNRYLLGVIGLSIGFCGAAFSARLTGEEPLRVVPQLRWAETGIAAPDGALFATLSEMSHFIKLVSKQGDLLWTIPLTSPADIAFSPDGKWLAACGAEEGLLFDVKSCDLRYFPALCGSLVAFTPDSRKVLVVRRWVGVPRGKEAADQGLFVFDLNVRLSTRFPVDMEMPLRLEVLPDGKTVRVSGAHGKIGAHKPSPLGKAEETIHLDTGKTDRDWSEPGSASIGSRDNSRLRPLPPADGKRRFFPQAMGFCWSESSGLCVQYGTGSPQGNEVVWDIRQGRFLRASADSATRYVKGFLDADTLLVTTHQRIGPTTSHTRPGQDQAVSLLNVRTGQVSPTGIAAGFWSSPGLDGKSFFLAVSEPQAAKGQPSKERLELYHLPLDKPVYSEIVNLRPPQSIAWSRDGRYFLCARGEGLGPALCVVSAADGKFEEISLADTVGKDIAKTRSTLFALRALDLDDSGQWLAAGMGGVESGLVAIVNRKTGRVETVLEDFPIWVAALRFVGPDRLLTGTWPGRVQLWDLGRKKPLWTTETGRELLRFEYVHGGPYVVCGHQGQSGTVLQLEDGKVQYRTSRLWGAKRVPDNWIQPLLLGRGTFGLETNSESMQIRLVDIAAGLTVLTFCALPDGQWIIYTPDGDWDGSQRVHVWVKFCDGLMPVSPAEADRRHRRERIEAVLKRAFP